LERAVKHAPVLRLLALVLLFVLTGCFGAGNVKARVTYWQQTFDENIPPGTEHSVAVKWVQARQLALTDWSEGFGGTIETLPAPFWSLVCSKSIISVNVKFDASGRSIKNDVSSYDYCL
jgi:hypothetical protein